MENASKALLISAGILIVMLVVTLLIFGWRSYSDYFLKKQELENIDNLAKFNEQFESYERDDVMGYELLSLANKVADYNERYSNYKDDTTNEKARNDKNYTPIKVVINIDSTTREKMSYDQTNRLFKLNVYEQSSTKNEIKKIIEKASEFEKKFNKRDTAAKVAKNIRTLVKSNDLITYYKNTLKLSDKDIDAKIVGDFNAITGLNLSTYQEVDDYITGTTNGSKIYAYYEYYQFKRMKFKCENAKIAYDDASGRISYMEFTATGEIE